MTKQFLNGLSLWYLVDKSNIFFSRQIVSQAWSHYSEVECLGFIDVQYNLSLDGRNILSPSQTTWVPICFAFQHLQILKKKVQQSVIRLPYFIQFYTWLALRKEFWKTLNYSNAYGRGILMIYILFRNMEKIDILRQCNETLNGFHLIIKFTAE